MGGVWGGVEWVIGKHAHSIGVAAQRRRAGKHLENDAAHTPHVYFIVAGAGAHEHLGCDLSVLHRVAVCCSVVQCVAACCAHEHLGCDFLSRCSVLEGVGGCCSVLQCVIVYCSVL